jgi:uncharacterized protein (TIGR02145 family)
MKAPLGRYLVSFLLLSLSVFTSCKKENEPILIVPNDRIDVALSDEDLKALEAASLLFDPYLDSLKDINGVSYRQIFSDPGWKQRFDSLKSYERVSQLSVSKQIQTSIDNILKDGGFLISENENADSIRPKLSDIEPAQMAYAYVQVTQSEDAKPMPLARQINSRVFPNIGNDIYKKKKILGLDCSGFLAHLLKFNGYKGCDFAFRSNPESPWSFQSMMPKSVKTKYSEKAELIALTPTDANFKYKKGDFVIWSNHGGIIHNPSSAIMYQSNGTPNPKSEDDHKDNYEFKAGGQIRGICIKSVSAFINKKGQPTIYRIVPIIDKPEKKLGDNQLGQENQKLAQPLKVKVLDKDGFGIPDLTVEFKVSSGGGSVSIAKTETKEDGTAQTDWTLGTKAAGTQKVKVIFKNFKDEYLSGQDQEFTSSIGESTCPATVTDDDGNIYNTVSIGTQCWMKENLKTSKYRDGSSITTGLSNTVWENTTAGAYAVYNNDEANNTTYGKLYNWYAISDSRNLCPTGWHVPSDEEWTTLENFLGGRTVAGGKMKTTTGWQSPNAGATNESGFSGLPGGSRFFNGTSNFIGTFGNWWASTEGSATLAGNWDLNCNDGDLGRGNGGKRMGFSVRCLRD